MEKLRFFSRSFLRFLLLMMFLFTIIFAQASLYNPGDYDREGQCELIAKEYQKVYGGHLIFIQPVKDDGQYDLGEYNGVWLNKAYSKGRGVYYIDYRSMTYFKNESEVLDWYLFYQSRKYGYTKYKKAEIFDVNEKHPPFGIIWHY